MSRTSPLPPRTDRPGDAPGPGGHSANPPRHGTDSGLTLWRVILAPSIWAGHFLICYGLAAVHCAKTGRGAALGPLWPVAFGVTLAALAGILWIAASVWRVHARSLTDEDFDFEHNSPEERHRFLAHLALMLAVLSAAAVGFTAWPVLTLSLCR